MWSELVELDHCKRCSSFGMSLLGVAPTHRVANTAKDGHLVILWLFSALPSPVCRDGDGSQWHQFRSCQDVLLAVVEYGSAVIRQHEQSAMSFCLPKNNALLWGT